MVIALTSDFINATKINPGWLLKQWRDTLQDLSEVGKSDRIFNFYNNTCTKIQQIVILWSYDFLNLNYKTLQYSNNDLIILNLPGILI